MIEQKQIDFYHKHGWLHLPNVFDGGMVERLRADLDWLMRTWAETGAGWTGPWRHAYMDQKTERKSKLTAMHDLHLYAASWARAVTHEPLSAVLSRLLDGAVELHHSTMHVKPPQTGHPFPLHQDLPFYEHRDGRYVDALVHLDDTCHANGEIRFLDGSHLDGPLEHIKVADGKPCSPHLPTDKYRLEDTVPVPAKAGDVVLFNIYTIHGSYINQTDKPRRMVRVGYRHPDNEQVGGQSLGRPGMLLAGRRDRSRGQATVKYEVLVG